MNYVLLIIDSLNYSHVKQSSIELMPFYNRLKSNGVFCDNMFSQAPYTEAAVMNLYCGQDVLHNKGYLFRFKDAKTTLFEEMKKAGYITYYNSYQPQCHPSSVRRGIDYLYYNVGYDQSALWSYRLQHFSDCYKAGELDSEDIKTIKIILADNFTEWLRFTNDIINEDESTNMIIHNYSDYDAERVKCSVNQEYDSFKRNEERYIECILKEGNNHKLFSIQAFVQNHKIQNRSVITQITKEMSPLFKRIQSMDVKLNLRNCRGLFKGPCHKFLSMIKHPSSTSYKEFLKSTYLSLNEIKDLDLFERINKDCDLFKNAPSGKTHIDHYLSWADKHKKDGSHFACIHVDDIHNPEVFFTYDTDDIELIRTEKKAAEELLDSIPSNYYGSLTHDLSLRYIDNLLKYFYQSLEEKHLSGNTRIAICADHGFSFSGNPLRDSFVINLYLENYNIPCLFTGPGLSHKSITGLHMSKDIPATICDLAFGRVPNEFSGHSLLEDFDYPQIQIEYCGGGCPDLRRRDIKLAAFDKHLFVGSLCKLNETLTKDHITEIYDLDNDPMQKRNLKHKIIDKDEVKKLIRYIEERRNEIRNSLYNTNNC